MNKMNTEIVIHPKLLHYGLVTANLDAMTNWYHAVLGMTVNHRSAAPAGAQNGPPLSAMAFLSNDEFDHRIVFFEMPGLVDDPDKRSHARLQHVAFECETFDDLLGTYARLKNLGILPLWAADHGPGTAFYYEDPDKNVVELNVNNYGNKWKATEHFKDCVPKAGTGRSRQDDRSAQGRCIVLGTPRACLRRRVRSSEVVRAANTLLTVSPLWCQAACLASSASTLTMCFSSFRTLNLGSSIKVSPSLPSTS
jgi:catechol 2,3-dioxygenase